MSKVSLLSLPLLLLILLFTSCKTREDIAREKLVNNMNSQMQDSQKLNADFTIRLQNLEDRLANVAGKVEESTYETQKTLDQRIQSLEEKLKLIEDTQKTQSEEMTKLEAQIKEQSSYIKDVLSGLKTITKGKGSSKSSKKLGAYDQAMLDYKKGRYKSAKDGLLDLLNGNKVKGARQLRVIHNLGMIAYMDKENDKALAYFSRLFTEAPKSGYNKNGLLYLAKTFKRLNKKEEAKQTLQELLNRFPKARQVKKAKEMLSSL